MGHADWYAGNTAVVEGQLVGTFDWELVADTEAVIAGFTASVFTVASVLTVALASVAGVAAPAANANPGINPTTAQSKILRIE